METIDIQDEKIELSELLEIALQGKEIILTKNNQNLVKISPLINTQPKFPAKAGSAKGKIWIAEDFDAPLADFEEYM